MYTSSSKSLCKKALSTSSYFRNLSFLAATTVVSLAMREKVTNKSIPQVGYSPWPQGELYSISNFHQALCLILYTHLHPMDFLL